LERRRSSQSFIPSAEEETMKPSIKLPLALGIVLAGPTANAASGHDWPLHTHRAISHGTVIAHAEAPAPPTRYFVPGPWPYPYNYHRRDGLSRNPDDCVKYGCVDSN
jgi:L-alanine-DL-glutamate epimerase-like enolase superfamily enzyme